MLRLEKECEVSYIPSDTPLVVSAGHRHSRITFRVPVSFSTCLVFLFPELLSVHGVLSLEPYKPKNSGTQIPELLSLVSHSVQKFKENIHRFTFSHADCHVGVAIVIAS